MIIASGGIVSKNQPATMAQNVGRETPDWEFRVPTIEDAADIHNLVQASPPLEPNSLYAYLLLCSHFAEDGVVAKCGDQLVGFVCGYRIPQHPDTLFVWQIAVHPDFRGGGLGRSMLDAILEREGSAGIGYIEATVTPSNASSYRLFSSFAKRHGCSCDTRDFFGAELFAGSGHEPEHLLRIGPL